MANGLDLGSAQKSDQGLSLGSVNRMWGLSINFPFVKSSFLLQAQDPHLDQEKEILRD